MTLKGLALCALALATPASAHRQWLLPSATSLSGAEDWVTIDAAVSNDLFYFDHVPMRLDNVVAVGPDGRPATLENKSTGKYRSTFDIKLTQPGTYRIANLNQGLTANWTENGAPKRWRGPATAFAAQVPAGATGLKVSENAGRVETFVTSRAPNDAALKPSGKGLELVPVTHPTDLVEGEAATFQLLLDGQPAPGLEVEVVPGGKRWRSKLGEFTTKTGADGRFSVTWPTAGMYWLEASVSDAKTSVPQATSRRAMYAATFEVMPQ